LTIVYGIQYNDIEVRKVDENLIQTMCSELRRGTQIMAVLSQLDKTQYGYSLLQTLEEKKVLIEAGTLYPLLRRLESQGLLKSEWDTSESRPRKYYLLNDEGKAVYQRLKKEWNQIVKEMAMLTGGINL
jgi:PadR family transcriptional regulator PadR